jgi:hypothetical protein
MSTGYVLVAGILRRAKGLCVAFPRPLLLVRRVRAFTPCHALVPAIVPMMVPLPLVFALAVAKGVLPRADKMQRCSPVTCRTDSGFVSQEAFADYFHAREYTGSVCLGGEEPREGKRTLRVRGLLSAHHSIGGRQ